MTAPEQLRDVRPAADHDLADAAGSMPVDRADRMRAVCWRPIARSAGTVAVPIVLGGSLVFGLREGV